jgi:hypothetical protein
VSTEGKIVLKYFISVWFSKITYFVHRLEMGIEIERHSLPSSRGLF